LRGEFSTFVILSETFVILSEAKNPGRVGKAMRFFTPLRLVQNNTLFCHPEPVGGGSR
jgi:hypothetical protein